MTGLEPATSGVTGRRSNQLSYIPACGRQTLSRAPWAGKCESHAAQPERTASAGRARIMRHIGYTAASSATATAPRAAHR